MRKGRRLSADESALWRKIAEGVEPLPGRAATLPQDEGLKAEPLSMPHREKPKPAQTRPAQPKPAQTKPAQPKPAGPETPTVHIQPGPAPIGDRRHETTPGLDRRTRDKLRRGRMPVEGRIDLHGKTQEAAHRALNAFLAGAQHRGLRCVLVITGRGMKPVEGGRVSRGVLKREVPRWLQEGDNRRRVLAYATARPEHGGEGALYVLLRRLRE